MKDNYNKNIFQRMGIKSAAYIKYGDVLSEYKQIQNQGSGDGDIGYLTRFCELGRDSRILLISFNRRNVKFENNGVKIYVFDSKKVGGKLRKAYNNLFKMIISLQLVIKNKPDFILCGTIDSSFWGAFLASKIVHRPIIFSSHGALLLGNDLFGRLRKAIHKKLIRNCDGVMCNGPYLKDEMITAGVSREKLIEFLPTFGELKKNSNSERLSKNLKDYILFVGRIEEQKGVYDLLSAYKKILKLFKKLKLVYAGDGSSLENLKVKANGWGLDGKVAFVGQAPYCNLGGLISKCRFVVIPSRSTMGEGICKVALEAQLFGKPVIVPNYGVFPYIVKNCQNGLLFEPDSVTDLAAKMEDLLSNQELYNFLEAGAIAAGKKFETPETTFSDAIITSLERVGFIYKKSVM